MNKDVLLGVFIGFFVAIILVGVGGVLAFQRLAPTLGFTGSSQPAGGPANGPSGNYASSPPQGGNYALSPPQEGPQSNGTLFGCPELRLVGADTTRSGIPFTIQNTDSRPHTIRISLNEYGFAAGEKKTITVSGRGQYTVPCDGSSYGKLDVAQ